MSTIKLSQLLSISKINANTSNTILIGRDLESGIDGQMTVTTLARGLYSNNPLIVGSNQTLFANTVSQFSGNSSVFLQANLQNFDSRGSGDYIVTADTGTNSNSYIDFGLNGSTFSDSTYSSMNAYDGYLYVSGPTPTSTSGNLVIGTASTSANIFFIAGGTESSNIIAKISKTGLNLIGGSALIFADSTSMTSAPATLSFSQASFNAQNSTAVVANTAVNNAASASLYANTGLTLAQASFNLANTCSGVDATQNTNISLALSTANSASSNTIYTQGVDATQNANISLASTTANSAFANTIYTQGVDATQNTNISLALSTANSASSNTIYTQGVDATQNANISLALSTANSAFANTIYTQGVDATQNANISLALTAVANTIYTQGVDATQNANISLALSTANSALQNTTGIFGGTLSFSSNVNITSSLNFINTGDIRTYNGINNDNDLNIHAGSDLGGYQGGTINIFSGNSLTGSGVGGDLNLTSGVGAVSNGTIRLTGNVVSNGSVTVDCANAAANSAAFRITGSSGAIVQAALNDGYMLQVTGKDNLPTRVIFDSFGTGSYGLLAGRSARGTASAPSNSSNNDVLLRISGNGYANSGFTQFGTGRIDFVAAQDYTDTKKGSRIEFWNTPTDSNTLQKIATFNANTIEFTGTVNPQKGFIYTPNVVSGSTATLALDIANTSLLKCNSSSGLTVTLSNFSTGKVVELWFVNSAGSTQTISHGCLANNSSIGTATFNIPGSSCTYLRYFSIDGDLANTFVSIQHA